MKLIILITVILMDLLAGMEFDIFVPSFPEIQAQFGISSFWVEAVLSINFIGYCLSLIAVGSLADRYGRKPLLLVGLVTFVIGSILCLSIPTYSALLIGRFLQGIGIAAPSILSFLIVADSYSLSQQQRFLALLNGVMNTAVALAPLLGSYITLYFHWQGNFVALLGLGILVLIMTIAFVPNYPCQGEQQSKSLFAGYLDLFKSKPLILLIAHIILMIVPYWIFVGMSPLLYMKSLGVGLAQFGYYQGSLALVFALGSFVFGWAMQGLEQKTWLKCAVAIFTVSLVSLGLVTWIDSSNPLYITLAFFPFVIGQIVPGTILYPLCLHQMPESKGQISAMIQGGRLIFCALALQLAGFHYQGSFQNIGIIMLVVMIMTVVTLGMVVRGVKLR